MTTGKASEAALRAIADSFSNLGEASAGTEKDAGVVREGFEISSAAPPYWAKGPAHVAADRLEIVLDEDRARTYHLQSSERLLFDLAGIGYGDPAKNAVDFVRRYGLLWHGGPDLGSGECRESLGDWFKETATLQLVMALYRSLRESVRTGSAEPLRRLGLEAMMPLEVAQQRTDEAYQRSAHRAVANSITKGLEECRLGIGPNVGLEDGALTLGEFAFSFMPSNMLGVAYAELAMLVGTGAEIKTCPGCGRSFSPESGKQKYHSKSCASTSRWRRWKEGQAGP